MNKSFTLIETLFLLFIISIMLNLSINLLYFDTKVSNNRDQYDKGE